MKSNKTTLFLIFILCASLFLALCAGCRSVTQCVDCDAAPTAEYNEDASLEYPDTTYVIYDTDIGSSTDDLFALGIIYFFARQESVELIGGIVCRMGDEYIRLADLMNTYYGFGDIPMGVERHGVEDPRVYIPYSGIADLKNDDGTPMFRHSIDDYSTLPDGWKLYRKLLASHPDHSVKIISLGFMSSLVQLLKSEPDEYSPLSGVDLVRQKVHSLYVMGGKFGEEGNDKAGYNFGHKTAILFSIDFLDLWPDSVHIYFSPSLPGDMLDYRPEEVLDDLAWIEKNPIKQVYLHYNCDTGQRMWDVYPALMALTGVEKYIGDNAPGVVKISRKDNGEQENAEYTMTFEETPDGYCHYQEVSDDDIRAVDMGWIKTCNTLEDSVSPIIHP